MFFSGKGKVLSLQTGIDCGSWCLGALSLIHSGVCLHLSLLMHLAGTAKAFPSSRILLWIFGVHNPKLDFFGCVCVQQQSKTCKQLQELAVELGKQGSSRGGYQPANSKLGIGAPQRRLPENLGIEGLDLDSGGDNVNTVIELPLSAAWQGTGRRPLG